MTSGSGPELLDSFYKLLECSWREHGTPLYGRSFFERIVTTFPDATRIHVATRRGSVVAVAFNGEERGTVEGMWAGSSERYRGLQPNYVLYWEMIRDACLRGFDRFHLGRSTVGSEAEAFKRKWNAVPQQLYWYYYLPGGGELPALNADNPRFGLAIAAWRRLPLVVTRRLGPSLARSIP